MLFRSESGIIPGVATSATERFVNKNWNANAISNPDPRATINCEVEKTGGISTGTAGVLSTTGVLMRYIARSLSPTRPSI